MLIPRLSSNVIIKSSDKEILLSCSPLQDTVVPRCMSDSDCSSCFKQTISPWSLCLVFISPSNVITLEFFLLNSAFLLYVESASIINHMKLT